MAEDAEHHIHWVFSGGCISEFLLNGLLGHRTPPSWPEIGRLSTLGPYHMGHDVCCVVNLLHAAMCCRHGMFALASKIRTSSFLESIHDGS